MRRNPSTLLPPPPLMQMPDKPPLEWPMPIRSCRSWRPIFHRTRLTIKPRKTRFSPPGLYFDRVGTVSCNNPTGRVNNRDGHAASLRSSCKFDLHLTQRPRQPFVCSQDAFIFSARERYKCLSGRQPRERSLRRRPRKDRPDDYPGLGSTVPVGFGALYDPSIVP